MGDFLFRKGRYALGILGVGFVGIIIYRAYFTPTKKEVTQIVAQSGSYVSLTKREDKGGITVTPFIEDYGFAESGKRTGTKASIWVDFRRRSINVEL